MTYYNYFSYLEGNYKNMRYDLKFKLENSDAYTYKLNQKPSSKFGTRVLS